MLRLLLFFFGCAHAAQLRSSKSGKKPTDVYYVVKLLDKLKVFSQNETAMIDARHTTEVERLQSAIAIAPNASDKAALQETLHREDEALVDAKTAKTLMMKMYYTLKEAMGSKSGAPSCQDLQCSKYGICTANGRYHECKCQKGYEGDGITCRPKMYFSAVQMPWKLDAATTPVIKEIALVGLPGAHIAVAMRDAGQADKGFIMVGKAGIGDVIWGAPKQFSEQSAYGITLAAFPSGQVVISYRNVPQNGYAYTTAVDPRLHSGNLNVTTLGKPVKFAIMQNQVNPAITLPGSMTAIFFNDLMKVSADAKAQAYGSVMLARVFPDCSFELRGRYRFTNMPVENLAVTLLTPSSFVIGYRGLPLGGVEPGQGSKELSVVWGEVKDSEFVVQPHPLVMEPGMANFKERDLSLVNQGMVAYSYWSDSEKLTKMSILKVDPVTHNLAEASPAVTLEPGSTPFIHSVSLPYGSESPHTLTYLQAAGGHSTASVCRVTLEGRAEGCKDVDWSGQGVSDAKAVTLWDGRLVFVFADKNNLPFYQHVVLYPADPPPGLILR